MRSFFAGPDGGKEDRFRFSSHAHGDLLSLHVAKQYFFFALFGDRCGLFLLRGRKQGTSRNGNNLFFAGRLNPNLDIDSTPILSPRGQYVVFRGRACSRKCVQFGTWGNPECSRPVGFVLPPSRLVKVVQERTVEMIHVPEISKA